MDTDLALTVGIVAAVLSGPALLAGWADNRLSRAGTALMVLGLGLVLTALLLNPEGYRFGDVPTVMLEVLARLVN